MRYNFIIVSGKSLKSWVFPLTIANLYFKIQTLLQLRVYISRFWIFFLATESLHCATLTSFLRIERYKLAIVSFKTRIARYKLANEIFFPLQLQISQFCLFLKIASLHCVSLIYIRKLYILTIVLNINSQLWVIKYKSEENNLAKIWFS